MFLHFYVLLSTCAAVCIGSALKTVYEFPYETWVENIAVRDTGELLVTLIDHPELHMVDPFNAINTTVISSFPDALGLLGIAEYQPDQFAVVVGNWSDVTFKTVNGSYSIWTVDLRHVYVHDFQVVRPAIVKKVTDIPEASFLNGLTVLSPEDATVLIADSGLGLVWLLNLNTGEYQIILEDPTMAPAPPLNLGINGIHLHEGFACYTNSVQGLFCRIPIHQNGSRSGVTGVFDTGYFGDDFAFDEFGTAYVTADPNNLLFTITWNGNVSTVIGGAESLEIEGATAAQFGRTILDRQILYITTNGGIPNPVNGSAVGGKIVAFNADCKNS